MSRLSGARLAVTVTFIVHGVVFSSWLPHIPLIKNDLSLSDGSLGLVLLGPPAGALAAMSVAGMACHRWGSARITRVSLIGYCLGLVTLGAGASAVVTLAGALLLAGALVGALDVAMNAQAAAVERAMGKAVMGSFHAAWSLAAAAGAGIGGAAAQWSVPLWTQLLVLGVVSLGCCAWLWSAFVPDTDTETAAEQRTASGGWRFERGLLLLSLVAFAALLAEGAVADWSAVFLSESAGADPLVAAWGYGLFSVAMFTGRLAGDRLVGRFGRRRSIAVAALSGGAGLSLGLAAGEIAGPGATARVAIIAGLCALGLGIAVIVPVAFSSAGDGPGIAMVSLGGYTGWLLGPAVMGGLGEWLGLPVAMWAIPALALLAGVLAPVGIRALPAARSAAR